MFKIEKTVLVIIDVQGKLASLMYKKERLFKNLQTLIKGAKILGLPILLTEQVPSKLGRSVTQVSRWLQGVQPFEKKSFSCYLDASFRQVLQGLNRRQILVAGIEAHVCVYQTVADLVKNGYEVQVVADAVSSRSAENRKAGLERVKQLGGALTSVEMITCELLRTSEHPKFREIIKLIK